MMNAHEANEASRKVPYGSSKEAREVFRAEREHIKNEFRESLEQDYAYNLPKAAQDVLWDKAWEDGHSSGFGDVEHHYGELVTFAEKLTQALQK